MISSFTKQASGAKYASMRVFEVYAGGPSKIVLVYDGTAEKIELDKWGSSNIESNTIQINQAVNKLASKGYELVSQSGGDQVSLYSFMKK